MRGTVSKRLRKEAARTAQGTAYQGKVTRFMTNKTDSRGRQVVIDRTTLICAGFRRVYQDLKRDYRRKKAS
jgi:hypothetical protein